MASAIGTYTSDDFMLDSDQAGLAGTRILDREGIVSTQDGIKITGIEDGQLIKVVHKWIQESRTFYDKKYNLEERRKTLEKYRFGRQLDNVQLETYSSRFVDNALYEAESYLIPIVFAQMPDVIVKPGQNDPQSKQVAEDISKIVSTDIASRDRKKVLKRAFSHLPVYLTGVLKSYWDPQKNLNGDYNFKAVLPELFIADCTAPSNDVNQMRFTVEYVDHTVKEWLMMFPDKKEKFLAQVTRDGVLDKTLGENDEAGMNSVARGLEVWFKWYLKKDNEQYEEIVGVTWIYKNVVLAKIRDPNWDWTGESRLFSYKKPVDTEIKKRSLATNTPIEGANTQTIFHNYLDKPQFPYFLMGYDQWGKMPYDETSRLEQVVLIQQNYDRSGKQVSEMLRTRTKHVFSSASGLKKEDLQQFDPNDPMQDLMISGDVREVYTNIPREAVGSADLDFLQLLKSRIFEIEGVNQPVRGQVEADAPATSAQIGREGDFTRADDLTDDTVNAACEWMSKWILQFIKLRYTKDKFVRLLGPDGSPVFIRLNRDMIDQGMEVTITASGVDKLKAIQNAFDLAKMKMIDPLNMFKDLDLPDPEGRATDLMMSQNPAQYLLWLQSNRNALQPTQGQVQTSGQGTQQAQMDIQSLQQGNIPQVPRSVDQDYMGTLMQFVQSPQFDQFLMQMEQTNPGFKQAVTGWLKQVQAAMQQTVQQIPQQGPQQPPQGPPQPPQGQPSPMGAPAGPTAGNTSAVAVNPPMTPANGRPSSL